MSLKITIAIPGTPCTVELPLVAIGARFPGLNQEVANNIITKFTADVTTAVLQAAGTERSKTAIAEPVPGPVTVLLNFRPSVGSVFSVRVPWYATIKEVKEAIYKDQGIATNRFYLSHGGTILNDSPTLLSLKIANLETLDIVV